MLVHSRRRGSFVQPCTLISADKIRQRTNVLAQQISRDYADRPLVVIGVLNGAFVFVADLVRQLTIPVTVDFLRASSYGPETETSGVVQIRKDLDRPVSGKHLLLVEDIIDTGLTASFLCRHLEMAQPLSVRVCALLDKKQRRLVSFDADYVGFEIGNEFVVGYGLDFDEQYRQLADICVLPDVKEPYARD